MRKLYLLATFFLAVTCIFSLMAASAGLFDRYEAHNRIAALKATGTEFPATVVDKRIVKDDRPRASYAGRIYIRLQAGPREGETLSASVPPRAFENVSVGASVTALVGKNQVHILELSARRSDQSGLFIVLALVSLVGTILLMRRIRHMPA